MDRETSSETPVTIYRSETRQILQDLNPHPLIYADHLMPLAI
jgi:hypothetical protein